MECINDTKNAKYTSYEFFFPNFPKYMQYMRSGRPATLINFEIAKYINLCKETINYLSDIHNYFSDKKAASFYKFL